MTRSRLAGVAAGAQGPLDVDDPSVGAVLQLRLDRSLIGDQLTERLVGRCVTPAEGPDQIEIEEPAPQCGVAGRIGGVELTDHHLPAFVGDVAGVPDPERRVPVGHARSVVVQREAQRTGAAPLVLGIDEPEPPPVLVPVQEPRALGQPALPQADRRRLELVPTDLVAGAVAQVDPGRKSVARVRPDSRSREVVRP